MANADFIKTESGQP